jgi:hypothetical protein
MLKWRTKDMMRKETDRIGRGMMMFVMVCLVLLLGYNVGLHQTTAMAKEEARMAAVVDMNMNLKSNGYSIQFRNREDGRIALVYPAPSMDAARAASVSSVRR